MQEIEMLHYFTSLLCCIKFYSAFLRKIFISFSHNRWWYDDQFDGNKSGYGEVIKIDDQLAAGISKNRPSIFHLTLVKRVNWSKMTIND